MYHWQRLPVWWWVHVHLDGRTDQVVNYAHRWDRAKTPRKDGGHMFTTRRTKRRWTCCGKVHALLAQRERGYFVTHTMSPKYDNAERRKRHALWLDRLRKEPGYRGHQWVTEMHDGAGTDERLRGLIHHHAIVRFSVVWNYAPKVQQWSQRYCASRNGLDIQPIRSGKVGAYMGKALGYMTKATGSVAELPFRWWGTSRIVRTVRMRGVDAPLGVTPSWHKGKPGYQDCARVPDHVALSACARATAVREQRKAHKLRLRRAVPTVVDKCVDNMLTPSDAMELRKRWFAEQQNI